MYKCIKDFSLEKSDDNGFIFEGEHIDVEKDSEWQLIEGRNYGFTNGNIRLEQEDGTWIEMCKETLNVHFQEVKGKVILDVKFNSEIPDKHDYKYFNVVLEDGEVKTFHHHKNNPIPTEEEIIGLTWEELRKLCLEKFYEAIKS